MSMPHRCQCRICNRYMDGFGYAWDQQTECRHEGPFSTMRPSVGGGHPTVQICYVCGKSESTINAERSPTEAGDTDAKQP